MKEQWKSIPNFEGLYEISTKGRIKSFLYQGKKKTRIIEPHLSGVKRRNYHQVSLYKNGVKSTRRIHWLMAITYLGHVKGNGLVVDHIDNNPINDNLKNLQLTSHRNNNVKDRSRGVGKYVGVTKSGKKWSATIRLGTFETKEEASEAYQYVLKAHIKNGGR